MAWLAGHDVLGELLARQPCSSARVRLLGAQPGCDGLPLIGLADASGDRVDRPLLVDLGGAENSRKLLQSSIAVGRCFGLGGISRAMPGQCCNVVAGLESSC
jgi:hypothetical protein